MAVTPFIIKNEMYEKLSDDVYYVAQNLVLRLNVVLGKKNKDGERNSFHNDYLYDSNKYTNVNKSITMRRSFDYFLTLENIKDKESIMIRVNDIIPLRQVLADAHKWFYDVKYKDLYAFDNKNNLTLINRVDPLWISNLAADKSIKLEPAVVTLWTGLLTEGVRLFLNSDTNFIDIPVDRFMGLIYIINTIDVFACAQNLINFLGITPIDERIVKSFNDAHIQEQSLSEEAGSVSARNGRQIKRKGTSFFDKIDEL